MSLRKNKISMLLIAGILGMTTLTGCGQNHIVETHQVIFVNYNLDVLFTQTVNHGDYAQFTSEKEPYKPRSRNKAYIFTKWSYDLDQPVTEDLVIKAEFFEVDAKFKVNYYNYDDTLLYTEMVENNGKSVYKGPEPSHFVDSSGRYEYIFSGWRSSSTTETITSDTNFYAEFKEFRCYHATFYNDDGSVLKTVKFHEDTTPVVDFEIPEKIYNGPEKCRYVFTRWNRDLCPFNIDVDLHPIYELKHYYDVEFVNYDGTLLDEQEVYEHDIIHYQGVTPTKPDEMVDGHHVKYTFVGWDKPLVDITSDVTIKPVFIKEVL